LAKYVSRERLESAVRALAGVREEMPSQGVQHVIPFLALKERGVGVNTETPFEERDDFAFWDQYLLVDPTSKDYRYYDPIAGLGRIASHPHSNVATARKGTFQSSWHAAKCEMTALGSVWSLSADYVDRILAKCLTKGGVTRRFPLIDLVAFMWRERAFPDEATVASVIADFRGAFHLTDAEVSRLFDVPGERDSAFFGDEPVAGAEVLSLIAGFAAQRAVLPAKGAEPAISPSAYAEDVASEMVLPDGVVDQSLAALEVGSHLILAGPPGTGKSTLAERLAAAATKAGHVSGYRTTTATADWTTFDTIGGYMPTGSGSELEFREGEVLRAIAEDQWCIIDELNRANIDRAIGAIITLLAGSEQTAVVDLPYTHKVGGDAHPEAVRIRRDLGWSHSGRDPDTGEYVIGVNWRLIATMNTLDRSNLFPLTAAFARRFATVFVGIPDPARTLDVLGVTVEAARRVFTAIMTESEGAWLNPRPCGPAIVKDAWRYLGRRLSADPPGPGSRKECDLAVEALTLYVLPQFSGIGPHDWQPLRDRLVGALVEGAPVADQEPMRASAQSRLDAALRGLQGEQ